LSPASQKPGRHPAWGRVGPGGPFFQLDREALTKIEADGSLVTYNVDPGRQSRRAMFLGDKLKMIFVEALPENIII
jgi:hypothetical protein